MSEITDGPALDGRRTDDAACPGSVDQVCGGGRSGATAPPAAAAILSLRRQTATTGLRR
jgi:hypothetical protein